MPARWRWPAARIATSSSVTIASGATFDTIGNVGFTAIRTLAGAGTVELGGGGGLVITAGSTEFSGVDPRRRSASGSTPAR